MGLMMRLIFTTRVAGAQLQFRLSSLGYGSPRWSWRIALLLEERSYARLLNQASPASCA